MTDLLSPIQAAAIAALKADAGVLVVFGANPARVYETAPVNVSTPFLEVIASDMTPVYADDFALGEVTVDVHVWSLTQPYGMAEARAFGAAAAACLQALPGTFGPAQAVELEHAQYLTDRDGKTAHAILVFRFTVAP